MLKVSLQQQAKQQQQQQNPSAATAAQQKAMLQMALRLTEAQLAQMPPQQAEKIRRLQQMHSVVPR
jgi:hypothetical protein